MIIISPFGKLGDVNLQLGRIDTNPWYLVRPRCPTQICISACIVGGTGITSLPLPWTSLHKCTWKLFHAPGAPGHVVFRPMGTQKTCSISSIRSIVVQKSVMNSNRTKTGWWLPWIWHFPRNIGLMLSSQLTNKNIFQRGGYTGPPTRKSLLKHPESPSPGKANVHPQRSGSCGPADKKHWNPRTDTAFFKWDSPPSHDDFWGKDDEIDINLESFWVPIPTLSESLSHIHHVLWSWLLDDCFLTCSILCTFRVSSLGAVLLQVVFIIPWLGVYPMMNLYWEWFIVVFATLWINIWVSKWVFILGCFYPDDYFWPTCWLRCRYAYAEILNVIIACYSQTLLPIPRNG